MLYNKDITMVTDRRTVSENNITKNMKADAVAVPRLKYTKYSTWYLLPGDNPKTPYYIVYLNKTTNNVGKMGINCKMQLYIGDDSNHNGVMYDIDTYTIGCYVAIADKDHLQNIIGHEPMEYIEKIIEIDTEIKYLSTTDYSNLNSNGYVYLTQDISLSSFGSNDAHYFSKVDFYHEGYGLTDTAGFPRSERINIYPNHKKKILEWQPTTGIVIQGNEFDIKDFNDSDFPTKSNVVSKYDYLYSTVYFFNFLGYTFAYPLGYKHEAVNMDYMIKWQSGRNFEYSSVYSNSLAYKELQEYNTQAVKYAKQQAGVQAYYNNKLLANTKTQIDISKQQSLISYQGQINEINTNVANLRSQYFSGYRALNYSMTGIGGTVAAVLGFKSEIPAITGAIEQEVAENNRDLLNFSHPECSNKKCNNLDVKITGCLSAKGETSAFNENNLSCFDDEYKDAYGNLVAFCKNIFESEEVETGTQVKTAIIVTTCTHGNRAIRQFEKVFGDKIKFKWCPSTLDLEQYKSLKKFLRGPNFDEIAFRQELKRIYCTNPELTQMLREEVGHNRNVFIKGEIDEPEITTIDTGEKER
jgi:hypothetical protein